MPSPPTWTLLSASVNSHGNQITLDFKVSTPVTGGAFDDGDLPDVVEMNRYAKTHTDKIGAISGWRMNGSIGGEGALLASSPSFVRIAGVSDVVGPVQVGTNYEVTLKYRITLYNTRLIAINNLAASGVSIAELTGGADGYLAFCFKLGVGPFPSPTFTGVTVDPAAVGMPPHGPGPTDNLRLFVDAHAQVVDLTGGTTDLVTWTDLSLAGTDLTGKPTTPTANQPALSWTSGSAPHIQFDSSVPQYFQSGTTPPAITSPATVGAVFTPDTNAATAHIVGRYSSLGGAASWRLYFNGSASPGTVYYQSAYSGGSELAAMPLVVGDDKVFSLLRRKADNSWQGWVNGRLVNSGTFAQSVNAGSSYLTVGGQAGPGSNPFNGEIDQVIAYNIDLDDLELSLVMYQMAERAAIVLWSPIPDDLAVPYQQAVTAKRLDRRPIAVITLAAGLYNDNMFGQRDPEWRNPHGGPADIVAALKPEVIAALYGCDQFEIMFNRPGGQYSQDVVMSYVFGQATNGDYIITSDQWSAMSTLWSDLNLAADNDDNNKNSGHYTQRRAWFYIGAGIPLDDNGALDESGWMRWRQVGPATPEVYKTTMLDPWVAQNDKYRCFFLDQASLFYGKFVEMVQDYSFYTDFVLVGESIPAYNTDEPTATPDPYYAGRGAPWFAMVGLSNAPWWQLNTEDSPDPSLHFPSKAKGYNPAWKSAWSTTPVYFGVQAGESPDLYRTTSDFGGPGDGDDLKLGDIYKWIRQGGVPISWSASTHVKVGTAWNYATGRVMPSRLVRCPRLFRSVRC